MQQPSTLAAVGPFSDAKREAVYRAIYTRRDLLSQFLLDPVVLNRLLLVTHHSPSVGFTRPWNFPVVADPNVKSRVKAAFASANDEAAALFQDDQNRLYSAIKLEGIAEAPVNLCIACDRDMGRPVVLGRTHNRDIDLYSTVCEVQNPWLVRRRPRGLALAGAAFSTTLICAGSLPCPTMLRRWPICVLATLQNCIPNQSCRPPPGGNGLTWKK